MTVIAPRKRTAARNVSVPVSFHARRYAHDAPVMGAAEFRQCMEQLARSYAYLAEELPCAPYRCGVGLLVVGPCRLKWPLGCGRWLQRSLLCMRAIPCHGCPSAAMSATMNDQPPVALPPAGGCLGDWRGWWLSTRCGCGAKLRSIDHMLDVRAIPAWMLMPMVVERLRCGHCRERPRQAELEWGPADRGRAPPHLNRNAILVPILEDLLWG